MGTRRYKDGDIKLLCGCILNKKQSETYRVHRKVTHHLKDGRELKKVEMSYWKLVKNENNKK